MQCDRLLFSRRAERQLRGLPGEVRLQVETHLENLALLLGSLTSLDQVLPRLTRDDDGEGFVTPVDGARVFFTLDAAMRVLLVHRIESLVGDTRREEPAASDRGFLFAEEDAR